MTKALGFVVLLLLGSAPAMAQERAITAFEAADKDGDGKISRDEFLAARAVQFTRRDRNGDGFLDAADAGTRAATRPVLADGIKRQLQRLDADGDGKISKEEFVNGGADIFERADTDSNGTVDAQELEAMRSTIRDRVTRPITQ